KHKAKVNHQNQNGKAALHWAAKCGYSTIAEILIKNKAQVDAVDNHYNTPLLFAAETGHKK
ncbi:41806_t:CDS:1, partial [Gigaspora margarita]